MIIVYCGTHPEYKGMKVPDDINCKTCELLFVLVCKFDKYTTGASSLNEYYDKVGEAGLKDACSGFEISRAGSL